MNERQRRIIEILEGKKTVAVAYLCDQLNYSHSTIRRDLIALEEIGVIRREKGIVSMRMGRTRERNFKLRGLENTAQKQKLAQVVKDFLTDGMSLFLDGSSTVLQLVPILREFNHLTVVTNGIELAHELIQIPQIELFVVGGYVREGTSAIVGEPAIDYISQFHLDLCIASCNGLDEQGIYEASMQQAMTKRKMLEQAEQCVLLCDGSKFDKRYKFALTNYSEIDYIITEHTVEEAFANKLKQLGCEVIKA